MCKCSTIDDDGDHGDGDHGDHSDGGHGHGRHHYPEPHPLPLLGSNITAHCTLQQQGIDDHECGYDVID